MNPRSEAYIRRLSKTLLAQISPIFYETLIFKPRGRIAGKHMPSQTVCALTWYHEQISIFRWSKDLLILLEHGKESYVIG